MRIIAAFFVASLISAPAFAQVAGQGSSASSPNTLTTTRPASSSDTSLSPSEGKTLSLGHLDRFSVKNDVDSQTSSLPLAPVSKDSVDLAWRPGGKWGITLDLTTRSPNFVLPREELQAGAYYQVTPRFRLGGDVTLKGNALDQTFSSPEAWKQEQNQAGVKLESAFAF